MRVHFVSHPEVQIEPDIPVVDWSLSDAGVRRAHLLAERLKGFPIDRPVLSSTEVKAEQTARILGDSLGVGFELTAGIAEIDRSATGYLPEPEFWATYHQFLSSPASSARGWETAQDAQRRIVETVNTRLASSESESDLVLVSHGGVGALLMAQVTGTPIQRIDDQPQQGCCFRFRADGNSVDGAELDHSWLPFERLESAFDGGHHGGDVGS